MSADVVTQLLDLIADDTYGLWEVLWWYQDSRRYGPKPGAEKELARVLNELVADGRIQALQVTAQSESPLSLVEFAEAMRSSVAWESKLPNEPQVRIVAI